ncbi:hypothetical protein M413DRAFT_447719 [Hebeloma cylindrosporum]|uniref:MYND-type domain-containing protein n=1 Tax=Hebeloma cylindrosporum TaxID=76867 RepID=A0A0C3BP77_HEBCY|nr:hypothetical protein M413DRAFT_447719 [Hebeloma cylindrosporum h7]
MAHHSYIENPLIADCALIPDEFSESHVEKIRDSFFRLGQQPGANGLQKQAWFRSVAQGASAVREPGNKNRPNRRLIAWKTGKAFEAQNLFFRTVDTSRLLPAGLADFRIQWYATKGIWDLLDSKKATDEIPFAGRKGFQMYALSGFIYELVVLRNMHDLAGGDIPIVIVNWDANDLDSAFDYWVALSKGELPEKEQRQKFFQLDDHFRHHKKNPCFTQADLLVRSLLSDPAVGYVPKFIVFLPMSAYVKARALFMHPSFVPPPALVENFPSGCGAANCTDDDCGAFDLTASRALAEDTALIRNNDWVMDVVRCNLWICNVEEPANISGKSLFQACKKCRDAFYCCKEHQFRDWSTHKNVCEPRAR